MRFVDSIYKFDLDSIYQFDLLMRLVDAIRSLDRSIILHLLVDDLSTQQLLWSFWNAIRWCNWSIRFVNAIRSLDRIIVLHLILNALSTQQLGPAECAKRLNKDLDLEISYRFFLDFPSCFLLFPLFFIDFALLVWASISMAKLKKLQTLAKI